MGSGNGKSLLVMYFLHGHECYIPRSQTFEDLKQLTTSGDWRHEGKHNHNFYIVLSPNVGEENIHFMFNNYQLSGHEFASICTEDCSRRLRGQYLVNEEVITRFP